MSLIVSRLLTCFPLHSVRLYVLACCMAESHVIMKLLKLKMQTRDFFDPGYERNNDNECVPVCEQECINGKCVSPNVCACHEGFQRSQGNVDVCEPKCSQPSVFGNCTAPETRTCNDGFLRSEDDDFTCKPSCSEPCVFGSCTAPDECTCSDGFVKDDAFNGTCPPICEPECVHGTCSVDGCICSYGWIGNYCEHPEFCVISLLDTMYSTQAASEFPVLNSTEDGTEINFPMALQDVPDCHRKCVNQLDKKAIKYTEVFGNFTRHIVSANLPCNTVAAGWESSKIITGSVFGDGIIHSDPQYVHGVHASAESETELHYKWRHGR